MNILAEDIRNQIRATRNQILVASKPERPKIRRQTRTPFQVKYEKLDETVDTFNSADCLSFFCVKSEEAGHRYIISHRVKDLSIMKKLLKDLTPREICGMIEFLFSKDMTYLDNSSGFSPGILTTGWCSRLLNDSKLWIDGKYKIPKAKVSREWTAKDDTTKIGEW